MPGKITWKFPTNTANSGQINLPWKSLYEQNAGQIWLLKSTAARTIPNLLIYVSFLLGSSYFHSDILCNMWANHSPSLPRPALHPDCYAQRSGPQISGGCRIGSTSIFSTCKSAVLPLSEVFLVLRVHSWVCVRDTSTSLQNALWARTVRLWNTDEQVWLPVARIPQMWRIHHGVLWIRKYVLLILQYEDEQMFIHLKPPGEVILFFLYCFTIHCTVFSVHVSRFWKALQR